MSAPHVVHVFPAFSTGGPEVRTCTLINALGDEFRHTVISLNGDTTGTSRLASRRWKTKHSGKARWDLDIPTSLDWEERSCRLKNH